MRYSPFNSQRGMPNAESLDTFFSTVLAKVQDSVRLRTGTASPFGRCLLDEASLLKHDGTSTLVLR